MTIRKYEIDNIFCTKFISGLNLVLSDQTKEILVKQIDNKFNEEI